MGALAAHWPFPIVRRSWMVYANPTPMAWGTACAFTIRPWLVAACAVKYSRADALADERGDLRFEVICSSAGASFHRRAEGQEGNDQKAKRGEPTVCCT
jgi:hypothetical protein